MTAVSSILDQILANTRAELAVRQRTEPLADLAARAAAAPPVRSFASALRAAPNVALIAEVKKASPSRGVLLPNFDHLALAATYAANGAAAISVLTDERFFQGSLRFLAEIRQAQDERAGEAFAAEQHRTGEAVAVEYLLATQHPVHATASPRPLTDACSPLLRKDFIVDPYQIYEARANGADALLLIVAALDDTELRGLLALTQQLGMDALVEVHDQAELERALVCGATIVGVNNRDLHSFTTALNTTERLARLLPAQRPLLVSESGIFSAADVARLRGCGVDAVLVGEAIVTAPDLAAQVRALAGVAKEQG